MGNCKCPPRIAQCTEFYQFRTIPDGHLQMPSPYHCFVVPHGLSAPGTPMSSQTPIINGVKAARKKIHTPDTAKKKKKKLTTVSPPLRRPASCRNPGSNTGRRTHRLTGRRVRRGSV
nr:hypothetical protein Itr_chr03CG09610 [Ipomoea trifida]